jgi:hypothetical protein
MKFFNSMNWSLFLLNVLAIMICGTISSQKSDNTFVQLEYFYQNKEVTHHFTAIGVTKYVSFYNQFTFDYHYALGWDAANGGFYIHAPAAASLGFLLMAANQGIAWNDLGILFTLIPEGVGMWLGPDEKQAHLSFNLASTDFYAGYRDIDKHFDYIPNIAFQQVIFEDARWGTLLGTTSLGYEYQKKWSPQNACIRLGIAICPNH